MKTSRFLLVLLPMSSLLAGCPGDELPDYFLKGEWTVCHENESVDHFPSDGVFSFKRVWLGAERYKLEINDDVANWPDKETLKKARFRVMPAEGGQPAKVLQWPDGCEGQAISTAPAEASSTAAAEEGATPAHKTGGDPVLKPTGKTIRLEATVCMFDPGFQHEEECGGDLALHVVKIYVAPPATPQGRALAIVHYCGPCENINGVCEEKHGEMPHPGHVHGDD